MPWVSMLLCSQLKGELLIVENSMRYYYEGRSLMANFVSN